VVILKLRKTINKLNKKMKQQDLVKVEFLLSVNDNIIVQRFFNVRDYNSDAENSVELYDFIREFKDTFVEYLKQKTLVYMSDNMYEIINNPTVLETSNTEGPEVFNLYIRKDNVTICHRVIDAKMFPPKIRYTVDVRPQLKSMLLGLTDIFSSKNLTLKYLDVQLSK
jgi:hypothetical protein